MPHLALAVQMAYYLLCQVNAFYLIDYLSFINMIVDKSLEKVVKLVQNFIDI